MIPDYVAPMSEWCRNFAQNNNVMAGYLNISKVFEYVQMRSRFSVTWVAEDGRKISVADARPTRKDGGFYSKGHTLNVICGDSGQVRKINIYTIIELDGMEVFI